MALPGPLLQSSNMSDLRYPVTGRNSNHNCGTAGLREGSEFTENELESTRGWLRDRAVTIYGGTNEVRLNIISKRVLGLPD